VKTKFVPSAWIDREGRRLDCGPYLSGAIEAKLLLEKLPVSKEPLHRLTAGHEGGIYNGPHFERSYVSSPEFGVPFLGSSSMLWADLSRIELLSRRDALSARLRFLQLRPGMTLISCSGTIGRMVYTRPDMDGFWSSQHIMKIVPDASRISPGYLYAFLASRYGVPMIVGGTYGAIIQHIEPEHLWNLPIPMPPDPVQERVNLLVEKAAQLRADASARLARAVNDIEVILGLPRLSAHESTKTPDISMVSSRTIGGRMDSMFHSNYHASALDPLNALPAGSRTTVSSLAANVVEPGRFRRVPIEDGPVAVPFFGTSAIMRIDPDPTRRQERRSPELERLHLTSDYAAQSVRRRLIGNRTRDTGWVECRCGAPTASRVRPGSGPGSARPARGHAGVRNPPRPVGILNDAVGRSDTGGVLHKNAVGSQLGGVADIWIKAGTLARFDLDRDESIIRLHQRVRFLG
jgi:type I restriction enzyme, S subunit